ncbi:MAG: hypothetical protein NT062_04070 [Proteobacteria bacterium]|nr:hypothetical protein [Pseudomonadota bacterium]
METPGGGPDGGNNNGAATFTSMVSPLVTRCLGCHSGVQMPTLSSFNNLQAKYKAAPGTTNVLVTKGDHQGTTYFTPAEQTTIAAWIDSL